MLGKNIKDAKIIPYFFRREMKKNLGLLQIKWQKLAYCRYAFKNIIYTLAFYFILNCTQGSIGNSMTEKAFVLQRVISIYNTSLSSVTPLFYIYDDQGDSNLLSFDLISNSITYTVTFGNSSDLYLESYSMYLSKSSDVLARDIGKHAGDNIITENPNTTSNVLTEKFYSNSIPAPIQLGSLGTGEDTQGKFLQKTISPSLQVPRGVLTKGYFIFKPSIPISITTGGVTKSFSVNVSTTGFLFTFECPIAHQGFQENKILLRAKISDMFKDTGTSKPIHEAYTVGSITTSVLSSFQTAFAASGFVNQYNCVKK